MKEKLDITQNNQEAFDIRKRSIEKLKNSFSSFFSNLGYEKISSVKISSDIDPSVRFIGSHISVMKPWILKRNIPEKGIMMTQNCLRTKGLDALFDDSISEYGSFFTSIGTLSNPDDLKKVCINLILFLQNLGLSLEDIQININSQDKDLLSACESLDVVLNKDTKPDSYYKHNIGLESITGRNFNFSVRNKKTGIFSDVGNVILLEDIAGAIAVEVAIGTSVLTKQIDGLDRVQDSYPVRGLEEVENSIRYKLEDSILVSLVLLNEGLRPFGSDNKNRILKKYVKALLFLSVKARIDSDIIRNIIKDFESKLLEDDSGKNTEMLCNFLSSYLKEVSTKKESELSKEDKSIKELLINKPK